MFLLFSALAAVAQAAPIQLQHQARLIDASGAPIHGATEVTVSLHDDASTPTARWTRTWTAQVEDGYFTALLDTDGSGTPLDSAWFAADLWVAHAVDGVPLLPRTRLVHAPRAAWSVEAGEAGRADVAAAVDVLASGASGACAEAGRVVWDAAQAALRVCDGAAWRDATPPRTVTLGDAGGTCDGARAGELAYRSAHLYLCDGAAWRMVDLQDGRPLLKASAATYTIAQVRSAAVDSTQLPRRYGSTICGADYHVCNYTEAIVLKYMLPDHLISVPRNAYLRTHGSYTAGEIAGTTHPHNALLGYTTGSWNGPSLACPNNSGPMIYMYDTDNRALGQDWDGGCYADDARYWACCLNRSY